MTLIIGGSGSGKSAYAERLLAEAEVPGEKYYLATMDASDAESLRRIERHRAARADKGFRTWECLRGLGAAVAAETKKLSGSAVLLECMSNLVANEMFHGGGTKDAPESPEETSARATGGRYPRSMEAQACDLSVRVRAVSDRVLHDVLVLSGACAELFVVTNNVFEDGADYDETTLAYLDALARINAGLAEKSDRVVEVVVGIPVVMKEEPCR